MNEQVKFQSIEVFIPANFGALFLVELGFMLLFGVIALVMGFIYSGRVDFFRFLRSGLGGGAALPPSLLLVVYPISERAQHLLSTEMIKGAVAFSGLASVALILYGLFKP